ncbi:hypothetical protein L3Q82_008251 [Scortum barcoo]|uniref:Uncharacterized protein n=1 Tax=Scortum barcoo TaxID=214431 RepID=A0ACB8WGY4_9TELE|nr:hypothetical protein L3Q82_008251 [Scortum barcoo]
MCRGGLLTSEDFGRGTQAFEVSGLKSCLDPTGGGVTLQGPDHGPGMKGRREIEERADEKLFVINVYNMYKDMGFCMESHDEVKGHRHGLMVYTVSTKERERERQKNKDNKNEEDITLARFAPLPPACSQHVNNLDDIPSVVVSGSQPSQCFPRSALSSDEPESAAKNPAKFIGEFLQSFAEVFPVSSEMEKKVFFRMKEVEGDAIDPPLCISDSNRLFSLESLKAVWHGHKLDFLKAAHLGHGAPNTEVVQLEDQRHSRILDYAKDKRPLILNFGSCT